MVEPPISQSNQVCNRLPSLSQSVTSVAAEYESSKCYIVDVGIGNYRRRLIIPFITVFRSRTGTNFHVFVQPDTGQNRFIPEILHINIFIFPVEIVVKAAAYIQPFTPTSFTTFWLILCHAKVPVSIIAAMSTREIPAAIGLRLSF